ncbi:hypothetical protein [Paraburkholderia sp. BR10923]
MSSVPKEALRKILSDNLWQIKPDADHRSLIEKTAIDGCVQTIPVLTYLAKWLFCMNIRLSRNSMFANRYGLARGALQNGFANEICTDALWHAVHSGKYHLRIGARLDGGHSETRMKKDCRDFSAAL